VGKFLAHAVIVVGEITERDNGADNDRRWAAEPPALQELILLVCIARSAIVRKCYSNWPFGYVSRLLLRTVAAFTERHARPFPSHMFASVHKEGKNRVKCFLFSFNGRGNAFSF
jgi:hypothetical protein